MDIEQLGWPAWRYRRAVVRRYVWERDYTADEYVAVLDTYSANRLLEPEVRVALFERIHRRRLFGAFSVVSAVSVATSGALTIT